MKQKEKRPSGKTRDTEIKKSGGRWYDRHAPLALLLEELKGRRKRQITGIMKKLKAMIEEEYPGMIDKHALDYPVTYKRRWYDSDPIWWLTINSLQHTDVAFILKTVIFLERELHGFQGAA